MSKYKIGDKFVIEIGEEFIGNFDAGVPQSEPLYRIDGFKSLVFDEYGLDRLQQINPKLKLEDIDDILAQYDIKKEAYNKGLQDAWELAKKLYEFTCDELETIFGVKYGFHDVISKFNQQEALAKLKAYEKSKEEIKVGDVVYCFADCDNEWRDNEEHYGVVTGIYPNTYHVLMKNGDCAGYNKEELEKTGKHIYIQSLLNEIRR